MNDERMENEELDFNASEVCAGENQPQTEKQPGTEATRQSSVGAGTAPPPSAQGTPVYQNYTPVNPQPQQPVKTRRIGTMTLGLSLIAVGVLIIASFFSDKVNLLTAAKLTPLILVFLGLEIVIGTLFGKGAKLKYDFLSGFVCFMLIVGSLGVAVSVPLWKYYGPDRTVTEGRLENELYNQIFTKLSSNKEIGSLSVSVHLTGMEYDKEMTLKQLSHRDYCNVSIQLTGSYADKAAFAKACKPIAEQLSQLNINGLRATFQADLEDYQYHLHLEDRFGYTASAEQLASMVNREYTGPWPEPGTEEYYQHQEELRRQQEMESQPPSAENSPEAEDFPLDVEESSLTA